LPKTTLHHEGNLTHAIFPYLTSTSASPKTTLQYEGNITHANLLSILKRSTRMTQLPTTTLYHVGSTSALPKRTTLQHEGMLASVCFHEGKLARVSFPYSTRTSPFPKKDCTV
jgi:hypothetical protein